MNMKKTFLITIFVALFSMNMMGDGDPVAAINLEHRLKDNHFGFPVYPADQPQAFYDATELHIIIDGTGEATYYDVDIISMSTLVTLISTQVNGTYDTIDVSSLPDDNYKIVITSSNYNVFEGYFTNY